jgi:hypothetical protein
MSTTTTTTTTAFIRPPRSSSCACLPTSAAGPHKQTFPKPTLLQPLHYNYSTSASTDIPKIPGSASPQGTTRFFNRFPHIQFNIFPNSSVPSTNEPQTKEYDSSSPSLPLKVSSIGLGGFRLASKSPTGSGSGSVEFQKWFSGVKQGTKNANRADGYGSIDPDAIHVVQSALEGGINVLDTSAHFGNGKFQGTYICCLTLHVVY